MTKQEITDKLNKLGCFFEDIYWEIDNEGNAMIMLDNHTGKEIDNIWDICYYSGFREDFMGNQIEINKDEEESDDTDEVGDYLRSDQFRKDFAEQVRKDTWGKGLPMIYMDKDGNIVKHWKDGTINILHTKEELRKIDIEYQRGIKKNKDE